MVENIYYIIGIISAIILTAIATITAFYSLQKSFREYIDKNLEGRDKKLKQWFTEFFEGYYYPLDDQIKNLNFRVKNLEKK